MEGGESTQQSGNDPAMQLAGRNRRPDAGLSVKRSPTRPNIQPGTRQGESTMNKFRVYKGASGAIMSEKWEILEQWGDPATSAEILEWAHESALYANEAYDRTKAHYKAVLAFAKT